MLDVIQLERQLRAKWGPLPAVRSLRVAKIRGRLSILVDGVGDPPRMITSTVAVDIGQRSPVLLPVFWRKVPAATPQDLPPAASPREVEDLNRLMWGGAPPVTDRPMDILDHRHAPEVPTQRVMPPAPYDEFQMFLPMRTPELPFWSQPLDDSGCVCMTAYGVDYVVYRRDVEASRQLTLRGLSYSTTKIPFGNAVEFRVTRGGTEMAVWRDLVVAPAGDPAFQFAFASYPEPIPLNLLVDHDQSVIITARLLGPPPFTATGPADADLCVLTRGWETILNDTRAGAPRPFDLGDLNDVAQGNLDLVGEFTDTALADAVQRVLGDGVREILRPEQGGKR